MPPAPAESFHQTVDSIGLPSLWNRLQREAGLPGEFVLLPATSAIGSYKNPELLALALADRDLLLLPLVLCGIAAEQRAQELEVHFPHLRGRVVAAGFSDAELALVYRQALAVVIPSRIEGFGLPAIVWQLVVCVLWLMPVACGRLEVRRLFGFPRARLSSSQTS